MRKTLLWVFTIAMFIIAAPGMAADTGPPVATLDVNNDSMVTTTATACVFDNSDSMTSMTLLGSLDVFYVGGFKGDIDLRRQNYGTVGGLPRHARAQVGNLYIKT